VAIVEHPFTPGALVPPHVHTREDEFSIVTAGAIGFRSGRDEIVLQAGGYITKPRGELHTMWNAGPTEARMIEVITPAGFEGFFLELADIFEAGPPDPATLEPLAASYGLFLDPTWVPPATTQLELTIRLGTAVSTRSRHRWPHNPLSTCGTVGRSAPTAAKSGERSRPPRGRSGRAQPRPLRHPQVARGP